MHFLIKITFCPTGCPECPAGAGLARGRAGRLVAAAEGGVRVGRGTVTGARAGSGRERAWRAHAKLGGRERPPTPITARWLIWY